MARIRNTGELPTSDSFEARLRRTIEGAILDSHRYVTSFEGSSLHLNAWWREDGSAAVIASFAGECEDITLAGSADDAVKYYNDARKALTDKDVVTVIKHLMLDL